MNRARAQRILLELDRRKNSRIKWESYSYPKQWGFISDPAKLKALQTTRRGGKSYGGGLYAFKEAYENPGVSVVIIGLTRDSVKRIFMKDILTVINNKLKLRAKPNHSDLTWTLPNGSVIYLLGVDSKPQEMEKLLGQKNKLVLIDEGAFFRQDMDKLIYEILKPSMIDYDGTIAIISTTSNLLGTLYYKITNNIEPGWSVHKWTAKDNPFIAEKWDKEIAELIKNKPSIVETPAFRRMYLNEWYVDTDSLVYKYNESRNYADSLPSSISRWKYVLGIDLGYNDASAFVVSAYNEFDKNMYVVETFKKSEMIISDVGEKIKELDNKYFFSTMVIDGASKQAVEELKKRFGLPLIIAEKTSKRDYIELLNSDLIMGNIKILPNNYALIKEMKELTWDERKLLLGKYEEHPSLDNHLLDSMLYSWRWCFNYAWKKIKEIPKPNTEEAMDAYWEAQAQMISKQDEEFDQIMNL